MQKRNKIVLTVAGLALAGLLVATQLTGNSEDLQGRFSFKTSGPVQNGLVVNQVDVANTTSEEMTGADYMNLAERYLSDAEDMYDGAYNAYLIASIPGLAEEGYEDFMTYRNEIEVEYYAELTQLREAADELRDNIAEDRETQTLTAVQEAVWASAEGKANTNYHEIASLESDVRDFLAELDELIQ